MGQVFFESVIDSFSKLADEIDLLDLDSGIRAFGDYKGRKRQLLFVTRSPRDTYTLMVYENKGGVDDPSVGARLLVREFQERDDLKEFMRNSLSKPVRAFVY